MSKQGENSKVIAGAAGSGAMYALSVQMPEPSQILEAIVAGPSQGDSWAWAQYGSVGVVEVFGTMWSSSYYGAIARRVGALVDDPSISAIVIDFDSPGGAVHGCGECADFIAAANMKKPVYAHVTGRACSAAYLLASACREIAVTESAEVGCLGTLAEWIDDSEWQEKSGIRWRVLTSEQTPRKYLDPNTDEGAARLQARLNQAADIFISQVARHRGVPSEAILQEYGAGEVYLGADAVARGMAERVSNLADMVLQISTRGVLMPKSKGLTVGAVYQATAEDNLEPFAVSVESLAAVDGGSELITQIRESAGALATAAANAAQHSAIDAAIAAERSRVDALLAIEVAGAEKTIRDAIKSGATAEQTALAIVAAQKDAGVTLTQIRSDAPGIVPHGGQSQSAKSHGWDQSAARVSGARK